MVYAATCVNDAVATDTYTGIDYGSGHDHGAFANFNIASYDSRPVNGRSCPWTVLLGELLTFPVVADGNNCASCRVHVRHKREAMRYKPRFVVNEAHCRAPG
jgi:hypothetical protein